jgi:hypothetical protein
MLNVEEVKQAEEEISNKINAIHKQWTEDYGFAPNHQMSCYDIITLLEKKGLLNDV